MNRRASRAVLGLLIVSLTACSKPHATQVTEQRPAVQTTLARYGSLAVTVSAYGRSGNAGGSQSRLSFAQSGVLADVLVHVGEPVAAGEALATLNVGGLTLSARQAQADLEAARATAQQSAVDRTSAKIALDEATLRRESSLFGAGVAARKDVESARAQLASDRAEAASAAAGARAANAQTESAAARAATAQRDIANATLRAPIDGIIVSVEKRPGEAVDPTTPVITIGPRSTNEAALAVTPGDVARVRIGNRVTFTSDAAPQTGEGRVTGIATVLDPTTQTATVIATGFPSGVPAGTSVRATIDVGHVHGTVIPLTALVQDPETNETLVFVQRDVNGVKFERRIVRVQVRNASAVIVRGVRPNERVASQGAFALLAPSGGG